ncbi:unnamed protein product [Arctogadus glacialis]
MGESCASGHNVKLESCTIGLFSSLCCGPVVVLPCSTAAASGLEPSSPRTSERKFPSPEVWTGLRRGLQADEGVQTEKLRGSEGSWLGACLGWLLSLTVTLRCAPQLLSFLAFVVEEVVKSCLNCGPLYFFEFISCTAFLFTLLLLILLATKLNGMVGITCWSKLDFYYTAAIALLFLLASVVFAAANGGSSLEYASVVLGFLATLAFLLDLFLFWKDSGFPWRSKEAGVAGSPTQASAEVEALNDPPN